MSEHEAELAWTRRSKEAEHVHLIAQARCRSCVEREAERDRLIQVLESIENLPESSVGRSIASLALEALTKTTEEE